MNRKKFFKNYSNRKVRRAALLQLRKGNAYRKIFDYKWQID